MSGAKAEKPALNLESGSSEKSMTDSSERKSVCMSAEEWRKTHQDFKTEINGQKCVLRTTAAGTALVPVHINKESRK